MNDSKVVVAALPEYIITRMDMMYKWGFYALSKPLNTRMSYKSALYSLLIRYGRWGPFWLQVLNIKQYRIPEK